MTAKHANASADAPCAKGKRDGRRGFFEDEYEDKAEYEGEDKAEYEGEDKAEYAVACFHLESSCAYASGRRMWFVPVSFNEIHTIRPRSTFPTPALYAPKDACPL
jgi:hypothetical protein